METADNKLVSIDQQQTTSEQQKATSQQKLNANRENAQKSTGPKTPRGKSYSRKNAIQHGLFVRNLEDFFAMGESREEYNSLFGDLYDQYQPIGRAEELEVEYIAVCWWRLRRASRYENAVAHKGIIDNASDWERREFRGRTSEEEAVILGVENLLKEIRETRTVPPDLKDRFLALSPKSEGLWQSAESIANFQLFSNPRSRGPNPQEGNPPNAIDELLLASRTLNGIKQLLNTFSGISNSISLDIMLSEHMIPDRGALDRILAFQTATERSLNRALDRLERLQRRHKGETVLPPVSVQLG